MTSEEFEAWAYRKIKDYLTDTPANAQEKRGFDRVKAFLAGLENNRAVLVRKDTQ